MSDVLIVGYGEVGKSLERCYKGIEGYIIYNYDIGYKRVKDLKGNYINLNNPLKVEVLHICIPYIPNFVETVVDYINEYESKLTIIHSTVPVGTTRAVQECVEDAPVVHSPVMGVHPNLTKSIQLFFKIIGSTNDKYADMASEHFLSMGIEPYVYNNPEESEFSKLMSTTYYGWNIRFMQEVYKDCEKLGLDFENVYAATNATYNDGYEIMGKLNVIRPILKYMGDGIGGHCVFENAEILKEAGLLRNAAKVVTERGKAKE